LSRSSMYSARKESCGWLKTRTIQTTESDGSGLSTLQGSLIHNYSHQSLTTERWPRHFTFRRLNYVTHQTNTRIKDRSLGVYSTDTRFGPATKKRGQFGYESYPRSPTSSAFPFHGFSFLLSFDVGFRLFWNLTFGHVLIDSVFICLDL
jgi:hypothetical protein